MNKVKKHPKFKDFESPLQCSIAEDLVDPVKIKERFIHLLDVDQYVQSIKESDDCERVHSLEYDKREQQKMDVASACYFPVKLLLSKLPREAPLVRTISAILGFKYGGLHAGLIIGDIIIKWNPNSLIVPLPEYGLSSDFQAHVEEVGTWRGRAGEMIKDMSKTSHESMDTTKILEVLYSCRDEKEALLDRLSAVIVSYNRSKKYSVFFCNCQHFVGDVLQALGVEKVPKFEGNLGSYFQELKQGRGATCIQFDSHAELDVYVKANYQTLDKREKEYLLCLYFQFHSAKLKSLTPEEQEKWECPVQPKSSEKVVNDDVDIGDYEIVEKSSNCGALKKVSLIFLSHSTFTLL